VKRIRTDSEIITEIVSNHESTTSSRTISTEPDPTNINNADEITTTASTTEAETTPTTAAKKTTKVNINKNC
jgi:hypothetical protein